MLFLISVTIRLYKISQLFFGRGSLLALGRGMPSQPGKREESLLGAEALHCLQYLCEGNSRSSHGCIARTQQMALLDGVSTGWTTGRSASICLSCPIPAALLGRGLRGKARLCLGRRAELCPAPFILKTVLRLPRAQGSGSLPAPGTAGQPSGGSGSSAKEKEPRLGPFGSHSWFLPRASLGQTCFT